jgi:hypothetical protein
LGEEPKRVEIKGKKEEGEGEGTKIDENDIKTAIKEFYIEMLKLESISKDNDEKTFSHSSLMISKLGIKIQTYEVILHSNYLNNMKLLIIYQCRNLGLFIPN